MVHGCPQLVLLGVSSASWHLVDGQVFKTIQVVIVFDGTRVLHSFWSQPHHMGLSKMFTPSCHTKIAHLKSKNLGMEEEFPTPFDSTCHHVPIRASVCCKSSTWGITGAGLGELVMSSKLYLSLEVDYFPFFGCTRLSQSNVRLLP